ncbi:TerC family protein [bacterium]|nr:TerC family protein [bacterium]
MPRRLPTLPIAVGLAVVCLAVARPARGGPDEQVTVAVPAQEYQRVEVELEGGGAVEGVLKLQAVPLRTDTGSRVIDIKHVRRVTFQRDPQGKSEDLVELTTKEVVRGRVTADAFPVESGGSVKAYPKAELREVRVRVAHPHSLTAILLGLLTLTVMEVVLGVDNVIFLAIVSARLPREQQPKARRIGLAAALGTRLLLLFSLTFLLGLTAPVFTLPDLPLVHDLEAREVSWRDIILFGGGLFLIGKSVFEMHEKIEHAKAHRETGTPPPTNGTASFAKTIATIAVIDIVFSLDSVITAVGMVEQLWVMVVAMVLAMGVMLAFAGPISDFVDRHPTVKVLALAFLILIGVMLVAEGLGQHMNKGYIYFAMAFAVVIEFINMKLRGPGKAAAAAPAAVPH